MASLPPPVSQNAKMCQTALVVTTPRPHINRCSRLILNALVHDWKQHEWTSRTVIDEVDGKTASDDDMERCKGIRPEVAEKGTWEEREMASL